MNTLLCITKCYTETKRDSFTNKFKNLKNSKENSNFNRNLLMSRREFDSSQKEEKLSSSC